MYLKIHKTNDQVVVALCDKELVGKILRDGNLVLDLKKYSSFYVGELTTPEKAKMSLKEATSINLVGKRSVDLAISDGLAEKGAERLIGCVPHLQIYWLDV
ncbi:MAG: DUF424 family protein [Candidatus Micrarchaeota archaeon]